MDLHKFQFQEGVFWHRKKFCFSLTHSVGWCVLEKLLAAFRYQYYWVFLDFFQSESILSVTQSPQPSFERKTSLFYLMLLQMLRIVYENQNNTFGYENYAEIFSENKVIKLKDLRKRFSFMNFPPPSYQKLDILKFSRKRDE